MKSITQVLRRISWYKWLLAGAVLIYLIYIALSYLYLPGKLKTVIETDVSKQIGREISVDKIAFNPFALSLKVTDLSIADKTDKPLLAWNQLYINLGFWKSLFLRGIALEEFKLDGPEINIVKERNRFNFSDIVDRLSATGPGKGKGETGPKAKRSIALEIFNTSINKGAFSYTDMSGKVPARSNVHDISIVIKKLYLATGNKKLNPFNLDASVPGGGRIRLKGEYRVDPLHVESDLSASGINLPVFSNFIENIIPVKLSKGSLSFNTKILAEKKNQLRIKLDRGHISVRNLELDDDVADPPMLTANEISVNKLSMDIPGKNLTAESVILDGIKSNQWIDKQGIPRYERLLPGKNSGEVSKETEAPGVKKASGTPWNILVKKISLKNSIVNFEDRRANISQQHSLSDINLDLKDATLKPGSRIPLQLSAMLDKKGGISADGSLIPSPFDMDIKYHLDNILLQPFSEYVENASYLKIDKGNLNVDGGLSISSTPASSINALANLDLKDLKVKDTRTGAPVLSLRSFKIKDLKAEVDKKRVSIALISLSKPEVSIDMSKHKKLNLSGLLKPEKHEPGKSSTQAGNAGSRSWTFSIDKISMQDGTARYSDRSVKPLYQVGLYNMSFSLERLMSNMKKPAPFSFRTDIDKYAPLIINGRLDPLKEQPGFEFTSTLKGLEMPRLSPYSAFYIGNDIKSGTLNLSLDYNLHNHRLKGENNIEAKDLYLGKKVPGEPVIKAPVGLGLALMRDISGVINLDLGVSGNLDDPGFSVSGIIIKALVNIFVKAAASPFKLLGALIPGGSNHMGEIVFDPGTSTLNRNSKDRLNELVAALDKRPQLVLNIKGNASATEDTEALKLAHVKQLVAASRGIKVPELEKGLAGRELWMVNENQAALEKINDNMKFPSVAERLKEMKSKNPKMKDTELKTMVLKQVFEDILNAQQIKEKELLSLADQRALSIKQYLIDEGKLGNKRVSVIKIYGTDLSGRTIKLGLDAM